MGVLCVGNHIVMNNVIVIMGSLQLEFAQEGDIYTVRPKRSAAPLFFNLFFSLAEPNLSAGRACFFCIQDYTNPRTR